MFNYVDEEGNELKITTEFVDTGKYRRRLKFISKSDDPSNREDLRMQGVCIVKDNKIGTREFIINEGPVSLMVYVHQRDFDDIYTNDMSYIDISYCTNPETATHYSTNCGDIDMTNEIIKSNLEMFIKEKGISLDVECLSRLLKVTNNGLEKYSKNKKELFEKYKKLISQIVADVKSIEKDSKSTDDDDER